MFEEQAIRKLYDIEDGYFDPLFWQHRAQKACRRHAGGVLLAGAGTGISVYRKLQRENVPFATGVLYENDVDYRLARLLAAETVSVPAFAAPDDAVYEKAFETMRRCGRILLAGDAARTPNAPLLARAKTAGLAVLDAKTEGWTL